MSSLFVVLGVLNMRLATRSASRSQNNTLQTWKLNKMEGANLMLVAKLVEIQIKTTPH
jgi:hypothetical protein